jgi:hypothetical protein
VIHDVKRPRPVAEDTDRDGQPVAV